MKKAAIMVSTLLISRLLAAQEIDLKPLVGEDWYGLYFNGSKAGYAVSGLKVEPSGEVEVAEDAQFKINQMGIRQEMGMHTKRIYAPDGSMVSIVTEIEDQSGTSVFKADIVDNQLRLVSQIPGQEETATMLGKPAESLKDALHTVRLVLEKPEVGAEVTFSRFEPFYRKEVTGTSQIIEKAERMLEGVPVVVWTVKTVEKIGEAEIASESQVAEDGTILEGAVAGMLTMRLEPKEVAQDVDYSNDVIVSNAAMVDTPIKDPRKRESLRLFLEGPLQAPNLFNDERQYLVEKDGGFEFVATRTSMDGFTPAMLPIANEAVAEWLKPTTFVQSDNPKLVAKAQEVVCNETNSYEAAKKLSAWVHDNVQTTYSARLSNALEVLENPQGDCTEHSILFVGLARAAGIPAREIAGLVYVDGSDPGFYFHQWASVWVGKWVDIDPTFNQPIADATHIKLAEGDLFQQAQLIPLVGKIQVQVMEEDAKSKP